MLAAKAQLTVKRRQPARLRSARFCSRARDPQQFTFSQNASSPATRTRGERRVWEIYRLPELSKCDRQEQMVSEVCGRQPDHAACLVRDIAYGAIQFEPGDIERSCYPSAPRLLAVLRLPNANSAVVSPVYIFRTACGLMDGLDHCTAPADRANSRVSFRSACHLSTDNASL
jgi:hypothetical protein